MPDIYQIAKNCRTSVEMIEKYYAARIKTARRRIDQRYAASRKHKEVKIANLKTQAHPSLQITKLMCKFPPACSMIDN